MTVKDYRDLYEGLTQIDDSFRDELKKYSVEFEKDDLFSDLERLQNKLNYAMLGVNPIYKREMELSGMVNYTEQTLALYHINGETICPFATLDPSYVSFLNNQKRIYNVKEMLPLSSVALKTSNELLKDTMKVPDISKTSMQLPDMAKSISRNVLETAFTRSMVLMVNLQNEIEKQHLHTAYGMNKEALLKYVNSNAFDYAFNDSVEKLGKTVNYQEERGHNNV